MQDQQNSSRNRGFAFIEYYNNACAEYSRQKMSNPNFKLDDSSPTVSWADPRNADSSTSSQVAYMSYLFSYLKYPLEVQTILDAVTIQYNFIIGQAFTFIVYLL